jgi:alpha-L-fucosidase
MAEPLKHDQKDQPPPAWYQQAKFGLFIHWGAYSVAGVEASWPIMAPDLSEAMFGTQTRISEAEYTALPRRFNPLDFDADAWVRTAQEAGMRYIVITSKHHDGFCMFDAPGTDYKITHTPYVKDICLELAQACANAGMPLGFYYSPPDMHHPGYRDTSKPATQNWLGEPRRKEWGEYLDYMESHIRKLLTGYGKVSILWFDGLVNHAKYDPPRFHKLVHSLSPHTLINDRLGDDYDFITPEQFIPKTGIPIRTGKPPSGNDPSGESLFRSVTFLFKIPGVRGILRKQLQKYQDGTLELTPVLQEPYPAPNRFQPWETCMTMGRSWAYNPHETEWKAPGELVRNLVEVVSRGGNYLLNVGPTDRGTFPPQALERLGNIGEWMDTYGESIYGSTYTPLQGASWGRTTRKGNKIYLHVFEWPATNKIEITDFPVAVRAVSKITGEPLAFTQAEGQLDITVPSQAPHPDVSVLVADMDGSERGLTDYSPAKDTKIAPQKYLESQVTASALINAVINGLIAFFAYRLRTNIPFAEIAIDVLITVAIISYLVSWIAIGLARQEIVKGNLFPIQKAWHGLELPKGTKLRALLITIACVVIFGGVILDGLIYWLSPAGLINWAYILVKTLYTGASGALASVLAILSVFNDESRR